MPQVGAKVNVNSGGGGGSGITQLTGDVTAGPGSGSKSATLVATTAVKALIAAWSAVTSVFGRTGAVVAVSGDYNATQVPNVVQAVTQAAQPTYDTDTANIFTIDNLAQAITSMTAGWTGTIQNGQIIRFRIMDNGTARAITWGATFAATAVALPTTTVPGQYLYVEFQGNTVTSTFDCVLATVSAGGSSLTSGNVALGSPITLTTNPTLILTTSSLVTGTYLVLVDALCDAHGSEIDVKLQVGTATATFAPVTVSSFGPNYNRGSVTIATFATVTVAGTLIVNAYNTDTGALIDSAPQIATGAVTGISWLKVA